MQERAVIVWNHNHTGFYLIGEYTEHSDGKALLYRAKREWPGHMVERVTRRTLQHLEAVS